MIREITILAAATLSLRGQPSGAVRDPLHASVENPKVTKSLPSPENSVTFFTDFDATVKNDRSKGVRLPSESVCVSYAELRRETGGWKKVWDVFCIQTEEIAMKDDPCSVTPPGGTHMLSNVHAGIVLENGHVPSSVTARFHLITYCREGKAIFSEEIVTEPVKIDLPATPDK